MHERMQYSIKPGGTAGVWITALVPAIVNCAGQELFYVWDEQSPVLCGIWRPAVIMKAAFWNDW